MILPNGLEVPRSLIELEVKIYSADVLLKPRITNFDKIKTKLTNLGKTLSWSNNSRDSSSLSDDQFVIRIPDEQVKESSDENEDLNLFVRISFSGITVIHFLKIKMICFWSLIKKL